MFGMKTLGFRLASIRNKAITKASKEYIIQIDGDIVLHQDFVKDHVRFAKRGSFVTGSRVLIREDLTRKMLAEKAASFPFTTKVLKIQSTEYIYLG